MQLIFYGADKEVTGSCHCLEACGKRILIDCGLLQGADGGDNREFPFSAQQIDSVIVTHAHIDHSGRLPLLVKNGYRGKIHATGATCDLLSIMLRDSAHIQEMDAMNENRKGKRAGKNPEEPLYTVEDAQDTIERLEPCVYGDMVQVCEGVRFRMVDAGHLLGSASVELWAEENGEVKKIVFSGDIGNLNQPIIRDPQYIKEADYVVMESTYGNREHDPIANYIPDLAKVFDQTLAAGGNVVIPSFAVGRTQELLYFIREMKARGLVKSVPDFPVYVDSPLAAEATEIYSGDLTGYADQDTVRVLREGFRPLRFSNLHLCESVEESRSLNMDGVPKVIISSSGMCEAGRIRHHLKHNLWRSECAVVFVGYQANGTLGRILVDGAKQVKLFGEEIAVKAQIHNFKALSGHADHNGLLRWIGAFTQKPRRVFVVHGEQEICREFTENLNALGYQAYAPNFQAVADLLSNSIVNEGVEPMHAKAKARRVQAAFARLVEAGRRLTRVIQENEGGANKDLAKFADQINSLCDKWSR
ncbi:Ribonuclease [Caprobacter fermentans]|uniref:Ribonuclease n=1 Tax=Caproicibacter fermentans TaxID=2576756 RepID=A0A6N8HWN6_9FIRM|nr:MBL fold metallo-hydrolase [Caproicibacter fermentans]MVB10241.1 Ribonuclease [Caproicibacter fermentans]OCN02892.1 MBL fold hydrolase [Clostridium sp. W14A]